MDTIISMPWDKLRFQKFITDAYYAYRGKTDLNWSDFAREVGVTQQTMAAWKNGAFKRQPDHETVAKLTAYFGMDVYAALGLSHEVPVTEITDEQLRPIAELINLFPVEQRGQVREQILDVLKEMLDGKK